LLSQYTKIDVDTWGAYSWFQGGRFAAGGEWNGGERRTKRRGRGEGKGKGIGRGEREKFGG